MELAGINQSELAKKIGVTGAYVSKIVKGHTKEIQPVYAKVISQEFEVPYDWTKDGKGDPPDFILTSKKVIKPELALAV